ncbi:D-alanyl-D-alanine carboxypeptidase/D-alanyl-D-alanine-endopeptidase [Novosphingobium pokkalii]|uniref:D-alanyl-D-alanine carboxypeptidase/D-alanyl-D-alanine-endopeptidase n=2 Tax=Novosphingobium pokkalii TaxID=1770194 RepID=A0ABV7V9D3_9SPHN|nr:peptidase M15 [Novosphingobium pokkalii]
MRGGRRLALALALLLVAPVAQGRGVDAAALDAILARLPSGARIGLLVVDETGAVVAERNADARMVPASTTKLFTTAAALALLPATDQPDATGGASVTLEGSPRAPDVVLRGHGDARLSSAPDCRSDCLATLADAVAARTHRVGRVIGDDSAMADERWPSGMGWDNMATVSATAVSALTLDDNIAVAQVIGGASGAPARIEPPAGITVSGTILTGTAQPAIARSTLPGSDIWRLSGTIAPGTTQRLVLSVADPAARAAAVLWAMLVARGVTVSGPVLARHRADDVPGAEPAPLARLVPPPLVQDVALTLRQSQNLHAELLLRRLTPSGTVSAGLAARGAALAPVGFAPGSVSLYDGSGMSAHNRVTPRALVNLLRWGQAQPWGAAWLDGFPVAGQSGTLKGRLRGTALDGRLRAKTGTLLGTQTLAGILPSTDGHMLTFAALVNDLPEGTSAVPVVDALLLALGGYDTAGH